MENSLMTVKTMVNRNNASELNDTDLLLAEDNQLKAGYDMVTVDLGDHTMYKLLYNGDPIDCVFMEHKHNIE